MTFGPPEDPPAKPKLPAVIKAGMILRGGGVAGEVQEIKAPPPLYPEGYIPPDEAHRQAQQILAEAAESARRLQEQARQQGYEEGYNAGFQNGQQAAIDSWSGLLGAFRQQIEGLLAQRQAILAAAEPDIIRLVLMATAKVIQREARQVDLASEVVARTLPRASDGTIVRVRVSPADYARLQAAPLAPPGMALFDLVADPNVGAGGCLIECHLCTIDATFRTLFEEVARELMRDEPENDHLITRATHDLAQPSYPEPEPGPEPDHPAAYGELSVSVPQAPTHAPGSAGVPPAPGVSPDAADFDLPGL